MITSFEDFCTWMYVTIDDLWPQIAPLVRRPGPAPTTCSDSELLTMAIVGDCGEWDKETTLLAAWRAYPHLFPRLPERSRFNRRRRHLAQAMNLLRQLVLRVLDVAQDRQGAIDSLPVPVVTFHLAPTAARDWAVQGAAYGRISSKKETISGYKLHLLVTLGGVLLDFILVPATAPEAQVGFELLSEHTDLTVLGDTGDITATLAADLRAHNRVILLTPRRRNQKDQVSAGLGRLLNQSRQIIETVNGQLDEQFHIQENHAHTVGGLCARLYTKLTAHTLCLSLNRMLGRGTWLQIKSLALAG